MTATVARVVSEGFGEPGFGRLPEGKYADPSCQISLGEASPTEILYALWDHRPARRGVYNPTSETFATAALGAMMTRWPRSAVDADHIDALREMLACGGVEICTAIERYVDGWPDPWTRIGVRGGRRARVRLSAAPGWDAIRDLPLADAATLLGDAAWADDIAVFFGTATAPWRWVEERAWFDGARYRLLGSPLVGAVQNNPALRRVHHVSGYPEIVRCERVSVPFP